MPLSGLDVEGRHLRVGNPYRLVCGEQHAIQLDRTADGDFSRIISTLVRRPADGYVSWLAS